jgi:serine/threonine-protein kinase
MPLAAGMRVGHYEILAAIGAGGMGEVWRARDTKLGRDVALKILPAAFSTDPDRLARFAREARVLASLDHPNIGHIYGLEESDGTRALVLALIEGPTLAERIAAGPLSVEDAIPIALQIAEAFEYAHDRGVIHRDLKPANIKVTPDGVVKVLDFGLAKALEADDAPGPNASTPQSPTMLPTVTLGATQAGMILGTAAYISPEQVKGKRADRRSDIWAFGVVLYEMLAGDQPFQGDSVGELLADVVKGEPKFGRIPERFRPLVTRCLVKDPRKRVQSFGETRLMLEEPEAVVPALPATVPSHPWSGKLGWIAAGVLAIAAAGIGSVAYRSTRPAPLKPLVRLDVDLGSDLASISNVLGASSNIALSPDGTRLAFASQGKLFLRKLDQPKAVELLGTESGGSPFFSPDGQWIAFFAQNKLKKIPVDGGAAVTLCDAPNANGGSWSEDGNIVLSLNGTEGLSRVSAAGGVPAPLTQLAAGEDTHRFPQVLPGGKAILFTAGRSSVAFDGADIQVFTFADHKVKTLHRGGTYGRYVPASKDSGYLVYVTPGTLFAVPFDPVKLEVRGNPAPVLEQVTYSPGDGSAQFAITESPSGPGTSVFTSGGVGQQQLTVQWLDSTGKTQPLLSKPGAYLFPRLSPDGERLAINAGSDAWIYEARRDTMTRLTFNGGGFPVWSPDSRYIVFYKAGGLFWTRSDGAEQPQVLSQSVNGQVPFAFSPDGKRVIYIEAVSGAGYDILTLPVESDASGLRAGKPEPYLRTPFDEREPAISPDGRWLAYASNESGKYQVYVRAFPDTGSKWQISSDGGLYPQFSRNGRELFFRARDSSKLFVASYAARSDAFFPEKPRVWVEKQMADTQLNGYNYDIAPDGKRVVALMPAETPEAKQSRSQVVFLENFVDELKRKVPVK